MNRRLRSIVTLSLLAACVSIAACSSRSTPGDLGDQLAQDTGTSWVVYRDPQSNEVRFLAPMTPTRIGTGTPESMARAFIAHYRDGLHGSSDQLRGQMMGTDARGSVHLRFEHVLPGTELRVFDSGTTAHFTADGLLTWMQTDFHADLSRVGATPTLTKDAAVAAASAHLQTACGAIKSPPVSGTTELGVLANEQIHPTLAYRLTFDIDSDGCTAPAVFVDATSGAPLLVQEQAHSVDGRVRGSRALILHEVDAKVINVSPDPASAATRYLMVTETPRTTDLEVRTHVGDYEQDILLERDVVLASSNVVDWDGAAAATGGAGSAVDAHYYTTQALAFLRPFADGFAATDTFPLRPLSRDLNVWVHANGGVRKGSLAFASYRAKRDLDTLVFGDGDRTKDPNILPYSAGLDVVAHEVTHLITAHTANFTYAGESGSLDESFSDVMGASAEHFNSPDDATNFLMGERLFGPAGPGDRTFLRDLENPGRGKKPQPAHYQDFVRKCPNGEAPDLEKNDDCGVHVNSGIPNRAFVLMVKGGSTTSKAGVVTGVPNGIGWDMSADLWYWTLTQLGSSATFQNAALAQVFAAYGYGAEVQPEVACAWMAVGVADPTTYPWKFWASSCTPPVAPPPTPPPSMPMPTPTDLCAGHGDHPVCDPTTPTLAAVCAGGLVVGSVTCADTQQACKPASPADPTATIDPNGGLVCQ